jgi:hypothetical protein
MLRLLKRSKADMKTPVVLYITVTRPILSSVAFSIQKFLSYEIERIQKRALNITVPNSTCEEAFEITGITALYDRRGRLCDEFFRQNINNGKMSDPFTPNYDLRLPRKFSNYSCKTDHFKHSFLPKMIFKENCKI